MRTKGTLTSLREKLIKVGARLVSHGLCVPKIRFDVDARNGRGKLASGIVRQT